MAKKIPVQLTHPADRKKAAVNRPTSTTKTVPEYDPEKEYPEPIISAFDRYKRMAIESKAMKKGSLNITGHFAVLTAYKDGKMCEAKKTSTGWKLGFNTIRESYRHTIERDHKGVRLHVAMKSIHTFAQFKALVESSEWQTSKLLEGFGVDAFDLGDDVGFGNVTGPPNNEYTPLMGGPSSKNLYLYDYLEMHAKCFWAKNHHPLGKAIIRTLRNYVIGKGCTLLFKNPDCQKAWDEFLKRAKFPSKLRTDTETMLWSGEIMSEKVKVNGKPSLAQVDPSTVWEIVTDPLTPDVPIYFHQQYPTQWQLVYKPGDVSLEYVINDIPGEKMIFHKINTSPGEKRGRSELFPVLSWLKRYRDYLNAKVIKAQAEASWALDVEVDGSQADTDRIAGDPSMTKIPPPGSTRVHNKEVKYEFLTPTASSTQGRDDVADQLVKTIAIGAGVAPEWLGESAAGSTKETARTKEGPASRNVESLQIVMEEYIREVAEYVMAEDGDIPEEQIRPASLGKVKQALLQRDWKKLLKEVTALMVGGDIVEATDKGFEVIMPEMDTDDRKTKLDAIVLAEVRKYITHIRAATMFAKELNITDYDGDAEAAEIQAEADMGGGNEEWAAAGKGAAGKDQGSDEEPGVKPSGKKSEPGN